jgi:hypothetical protein
MKTPTAGLMTALRLGALAATLQLAAVHPLAQARRVGRNRPPAPAAPQPGVPANAHSFQGTPSEQPH